MISRARAVAAGVLALACACQDPGGLEVRVAKIEVEPTAIDFGRVPVGTIAERQLVVRNTGESPLILAEVALETPADTAFGVTIDRAALAPTDQAIATIRFAPVDAGNRSATLIVRTDDDRLEPSRIDVHGESVAATLLIEPTAIDFGGVLLGSAKTLALTITNSGDIGATAAVIAGDGVQVCGTGGSEAGVFCVAVAELAVGAGETGELEITYRPALAGIHDRGSFRLRSCRLAECEQAIALDGDAIEQGFACPPVLNFGLRNPGTCTTLAASCQNVANQPISILGWALGARSSPEFSSSATVAQALVPGEVVSIPATYCPIGTGESAGAIEIAIEQPVRGSEQVIVRLAGRAGGPDIAVFPSSIDFGRVASGAPARRVLLIENAGYAPLAIQAIDPDALQTASFTTTSSSAVLRPGAFLEVTIELVSSLAGAVRSEIAILSDDPDQPEVRVPVTAELIDLPPCTYAVRPPRIAFGVVAPARVASRAIAIDNLGASDCLLDAARLLPGAAAELAIDAGETPRIIAAASSTEVIVEYRPLAPGRHVGRIELALSSPSAPFYELSVDGIAAESALLIAPNELEFGAVPAGCTTSARLVNIYNTGALPATLSSIALATDTSTTFSLAGLPALPLELAPGMSASFGVEFFAASRGDFRGVVEIHAGADTYFVGLSARGELGTQVDRFEQNVPARADILFVVDGSGSMTEERDALAAGFESFIALAGARGIDYHLAVTDMDLSGGLPFPHAPGVILPPSSATDRIITRATLPSPAEVFETNTQALGWSGDEGGIEAAYSALSYPVIAAENAGFLRADAALSIIFISDEEDGSWRSIDFYDDAFSAIVGRVRRNAFSISAITGELPNGCATASEAGSRYIELAHRTGGAVESICTPDWAASLREISMRAFGLRTRFFLSGAAVASSIVVHVGGAPAAVWSYDAASNAIDFQAAPPAGALITIEYSPACN